MAERPEDLNLPNAVITRIIKEAVSSCADGRARGGQTGNGGTRSWVGSFAHPHALLAAPGRCQHLQGGPERHLPRRQRLRAVRHILVRRAEPEGDAGRLPGPEFGAFSPHTPVTSLPWWGEGHSPQPIFASSEANKRKEKNHFALTFKYRERRGVPCHKKSMHLRHGLSHPTPGCSFFHLLCSQQGRV